MTTPERPPVTVALPVYNGSRFVAETVASVLGQRGWHVHLVAVDDGSTDDSRDVLRALAAGDSRITVLEQPSNLGVAAARTRAIARRDDPLIAFIDQDDRWTDDRLDIAWQSLGHDSSLDFVLAHQRFSTISEVLPAWFRPRWLQTPQPAHVFGAMLGWRARTWDVIGGLDESLRMGDDVDWFIRAKDRGLVSQMLPNVVLDRLIHDANTSANTGQSVRELVSVLRRRQTGSDRSGVDDQGAAA